MSVYACMYNPACAVDVGPYMGVIIAVYFLFTIGTLAWLIVEAHNARRKK